MLDRSLNFDALPPNAAASNGFVVWLDKGGGWTKRVRRVRLSGLCLSRMDGGVRGIRARIANRVFNGVFDRARPDLLQALGLPETTAHAGFRIDAQIPFGKSELTIEAADADDSWQKVFSHKVRGPLFAGAADRSQWRDVELQDARRRYASELDVPQPWNAPAEVVHISGWCVDTVGEKIDQIRAIVGRRKFRATFGLLRPDLTQRFPDVFPRARAVFGIALRVPRGARQLSIEVKQNDHPWREFCRRKIVRAPGELIAKEAPRGIDFQAGPHERSRFEFWFDRPADWSKRRRYLHVSGWCFAVEGPRVTDIRARIGGEIFPARYGVVRPDVAARLQGLPGAFPSGFFVDVILPAGNRKLLLEAQSEDGEWEQFWARRVKGPILVRRSDDIQEQIGNYSSWISAYDTLTRSDRRHIRAHIRRFKTRPLISVLLPVFNTEERWLTRAIQSVRDQLYPNWELCIVDDGSTASHVWPLITQSLRTDPRIKARRLEVSGHISAATNAALELAGGDFVAFLDHDDELAPTAFYFAALEINRDANVKFIYSDEDKLDSHGRRCDPHFKTDWNPDLLPAQNFVSHLSVISTALVREVGGLRIGYEGAQDYDLVLRCSERLAPAQICHVPRVLYHWRCSTESTASFADSKPYAHDAAIRAVTEHFRRTGLAQVEVARHRVLYRRAIYPLPPDQPLLSIIIPTRDHASFLCRCLTSLVSKTAYRNFEVIVVDNGSRDKETTRYLAELQSSGQARILRVDEPFNYSRLNNLAVSEARGDYIVLLNDDLEIVDPQWLSEMLAHACRPEIGAVGALLRYPDGRIQHGGVILGQKGIGAHAHAGLIDEDGYFSRPHLVQNFSAVTAACLLTRREVYRQLGGLDETHLTVAFNDVDFCLRLQKVGLRILWTPFAELRHYESSSRGPEDTLAKQERFASEVQYMLDRWSDVLRNDPFYNPNLALDKQLFSLAFPPRVEKPWVSARRN